MRDSSHVDRVTADLRRATLELHPGPRDSRAARLAGEILAVLAWLAPVDLPRHVLAPLGTPGEVDAALDDLMRDGLISLHRDHLRAEGLDRVDAAAARAVDLLDRAWPRDDDPEAWAALMPHVDHVLAQPLPPETAEQVAGLREAVGCFLVSRGEHVAGIGHLARAHLERVRELGVRHPDTLRARSNLAYAYTVAGRPVRAIPLLQEVVGDRIRLLGADHPQTLKARANLACVYEAAGDPVKAVRLFERVLADQARVLGEDHPDTVRTRVSLAWAYAGTGRPAEAIPLLQRVVRHHTRTLGPDHPDTLDARGALACAYESASDLPRAAWLFERLLADQTRVLGTNHPDTARTRDNLAHARAEVA
jgi:tetratricopeptide (TPR) repeat protein